MGTTTVSAGRGVSPRAEEEASAPSSAIRAGKLAVGIAQVPVIGMVANQYPSLTKAVEEAAQNAFDELPKRVVITIDARPKSRLITIEDNGRGCSIAQFAQVIANICKSDKVDNVRYSNALGQFGLGKVAFLDKAGVYKFISAPAEGKGGQANWEGYTEHDFSALISNPESMETDFKERRDLNQKKPWWNTRVEVSDFKVGRFFVDPDELARTLGSKYADKIAENKTEVVINFTDAQGKQRTLPVQPADKFNGQAFKRHTSTGSSCKNVVFELYRLEQPTGTVFLKLTGSPFRLPFASLIPNFATYLNREEQALMKDLASGYIEGVIHISGCTLSHSRTSLKEDDAYVEFLMFALDWVRDIGMQHLDRVKPKSKGKVREKVLVDVLAYFNEMDQVDNHVLRDLLQQLPARTSRGSIEPKPTTPREEKTTAEETVRLPTPTKPRQSRRKNKPQNVVMNDRGRTVIADPGLGLRLSYDEMPGSSRRCELDSTTGVFRINNRHPDFVECETLDDNPDSVASRLQAYVIAVMRHAFGCLTLSDRLQDEVMAYESRVMRMVMIDIRNMKVSRRRS